MEPLDASRKLATAEMARRGRSLFKDGSPKARWEYTSGLFAHSLIELGKATGDAAFTRYGTDLTTSFVDPHGSITTYKPDDFNIDMILPGRALLHAWEVTKDPTQKAALDLLRRQLANQPRTNDGGFWHKQRYPWQMWLDGLYMGSPFLGRYGKTFGEPAAFDEVVRQITLMDQHAYDPGTGLYFHGWDEKRAQSWANKQTGLSPCFWSRSIGWYAMAIVDCLDDLPPTHEGTAKVHAILRKLAAGVVRHQDTKSGLWWQVMDQGGREGNYLESTASAMFVYAIAKGVNRGYLDRATYLEPALNGFCGLLRDCVRTDADGALCLTHCCEVAGLGFTSAAGRPRDGTFEYYISEPVIENDLKGVGPFILAGIEVSKLASTNADAVVAADGSGTFTTVQEAINKAPQKTTADKPWTILVKPGTYHERVYVQREKRFVRLVGEDAMKTKITFNLYAAMLGRDGKEIGTFRTPTVQIDADDFTIANLTIENSAGPVGQALALRVDGDRAAFRNCRFLGFQDTILLNRGRQHFRDCFITGAVDFIFGGATAWLERSTIECVRDGYITAASTPPEQPFGFVFADCEIRMAKPGLKVYLGRPWRPHAATLFLRTVMPEGIRPEGWHNWNAPDREKTARYAEIQCTGPGAEPSARAPWVNTTQDGNRPAPTMREVLVGWNP